MNNPLYGIPLRDEQLPPPTLSDCPDCGGEMKSDYCEPCDQIAPTCDDCGYHQHITN
jgi:hypothetical protein